MPNDDEPVRFEHDIKPLFRERDQQSMKSHFDLWAYTDVSLHADAILARLRDGVSLQAVRKLMGHRNVQTTLRYAETDMETVRRELVEARRRRGTR